MLKVFAAAAVLVASFSAHSAPQTTTSILDCQSIQRTNNADYRVNLMYLADRPQGRSYGLSTTVITKDRQFLTRELAFDMANPRQAGPMNYITTNYALAVNYFVPAGRPVSALLRVKGGVDVQMICQVSVMPF